MKKIIEIECCYVCPHYGLEDLNDRCYHISRRMWLIEAGVAENIPSWCPLPDAPKEKES